jgi:hypothetical protein
MTDDEVYQAIVAAAERHGQADDPDHEVGDLQDALRTACSLLSPDTLKILHKEYFDDHEEG